MVIKRVEDIRGKSDIQIACIGFAKDVEIVFLRFAQIPVVYVSEIRVRPFISIISKYAYRFSFFVWSNNRAVRIGCLMDVEVSDRVTDTLRRVWLCVVRR